MMDAAEEALLERGVDKHKIHIERFTADRPSAAVEAQMHALQDQARGLTMQVTLDGRKRRVAFDAAAGTILDSARAEGLPAPPPCKAGVCDTGRARVIPGEVTMVAPSRLSTEQMTPTTDKP